MGAVQKGLCVPSNRPQDAHFHLKQSPPYQPAGGSSQTSPSSHYVNVAVTSAQRKVSESAVAAAGKGKRPPTRERRNSFREAMETRGKENSGGDDDDEDCRDDDGAPKKSYESIWFGKEQTPTEHTYENSPLRQQQQQQHPGIPNSRQQQRTSASSLARQALLNPPNSSYDRKSPTPTSGESGGYEPVNFRKLSTGQQQLYQTAVGNNSQLQSVGLVSEVVNRQQQQQHEQNRLSDMSPSSPVRSPPPQPLGAAKTSPLRTPPSHTPPSQMPQPPPYKSPPNPSRVMLKTSPVSSAAAVAAPQQRQKVSPKRLMQQLPPSTMMTTATAAASPPNPHLQQRDLQHQNYVNVHVARRHSRDTGKYITVIHYVRLHMKCVYFSRCCHSPSLTRTH